MQTSCEKLKAFKTLTERSDFLKIQSSGRKWVSQSMILQIGQNDLGVMRVGYTVSKKVDKSAVRRNRIKRRLRAAAADILSEHGQPGMDYVLVGRPATALRPYGVLKSDLIWCLKKMGLCGEAQGT
jgi:ribonuclease P protein component